MRDALVLYSRYISVSLRAQMKYRMSFVMLTLGHFAMTGLEFIGIWVLFARFQRLDIWSLHEVALENTGLMRFARRGSGHWRVESVNETPHLCDDL